MHRRDKLERYLKALAQCNTPVHILITLEYKLLLTQELPYSQHYQCATSLTSVHKNILIASIRHQNVLGWDSFLKGFISSYWGPIYTTLTVLSTNTGTRQWQSQFKFLTINLYRDIWADCYAFLHGKTYKECSQIERKHTLQSVTSLYRNPPKLDKRFSNICDTPIRHRYTARPHHT
jgi:hypothetical protein